MRLGDYVSQYKNMAETFLASHNLTCEAILTGRDAWTVAHKVGITNHAYALSRDIYDAHIQTALEKVFPNAVFNDKKVY